MARQLQPSQEQPSKEIGFKTVQLLKKQTLGIGSYGSVCKVMCDDLLCAAKIIHPTLFDPNAHQQISPQREHRLPIRRFERECAFLKDIRHPNIVQYLGVYQDPETGLPVLLMELMDESLTHFLENATEPVPYHIQLTICLDIARALSFLHSNSIIHRDLSSNNILLIGKSRAKLTDFGMAKLTEADRFMSRVSNTLCPGTDAYMPPEAIDKHAVYTEKGDVFSFGVNIIQILTRQFPDPGDRFKTMHIDHPQFPSGRVEVRSSEIERRNNHISTIDAVHPLLPIALDCLKDQEGGRPSLGELCQRLSTLRDTPEYTESEREGHERGMVGQRSLAQQISELHQQIQSSQQAVVVREQENQRLRQDVFNATSVISAKEQVISAKEQEIQQLEATLHDVLEAKESTSHQREENRERVKRLSEEVQQSPQPEYPPVSFGTRTQSSEPSNVEEMTLNTRYGENAPYTMARSTDAVVNGSVAYFKPDRSEILLAFNSITDTWSQLPDCLAKLTTLAVIKDQLTTVGGKKTNCLYSLVEEGNRQSWTEVFPPMPTTRQNVAAVCTDTVLIVAGGEEHGLVHDKTLTTVEIMNTENKQWSAAAELPIPLYRVSATICGSNLYMLGGWSKGPNIPCSVFKCSIPGLSTSPLLQQWSRVADHPCIASTCVTMKGQLLSVGGLSDSDAKTSTSIHMYNQANNSWVIIGRLNTARHQCFAVFLPDSRLMVVGGICTTFLTTPSNTVEFVVCV